MDWEEMEWMEWNGMEMEWMEWIPLKSPLRQSLNESAALQCPSSPQDEARQGAVLWCLPLWHQIDCFVQRLLDKP